MICSIFIGMIEGSQNWTCFIVISISLIIINRVIYNPKERLIIKILDSSFLTQRLQAGKKMAFNLGLSLQVAYFYYNVLVLVSILKCICACDRLSV